MKKHFTLLLLALTTILSIVVINVAFAQVSGQVYGTNGAPMPAVTVTLLKKADSVSLLSTVTDEKGGFRFNAIPAGSYFLRLSSIGYQVWNSEAFSSPKYFETIVLQENNNRLGEVVVRAARPIIEQRTDGTVINVGSSILSNGSSALDVLERSPGVIIDHQNNDISLNGKNGVSIMLDGKLLRMPADQVQNLLKGMSADGISKIELLTSPSAGYDAEGSAGIINIVSKKIRKQGTNGSFTLDAGYGYGEKAGAGFNLEHRKDNTTIYGSYHFTHDRSYGGFLATGSELEPYLGGLANSSFLSVTKPVQNSHQAQFGFDTKLGSKTGIGGSVVYSSSDVNSRMINTGIYHVGADSVYRLNAVTDGQNQWRSIIADLYAERQFSDKEKLNLDVDYLSYRNNYPATSTSSFADQQGKQIGSNDTLFSPQTKGMANTLIRVGTAKLDYSKQVTRGTKIDAGIKGTYTQTSSVSAIENLVNGAFVSRPAAVNDIVMKEGIGAAYVAATTKLDSLTDLVAGVRYEYSQTLMNDPQTGQSLARRYVGAFFPNVLLTRKLNDHSEFYLSYSRRISRPSYNDLASFITYNGPTSVNTGNPLLKPTLTNNLKLGYNYDGYAFSLLMSHDQNPIVRYQIVQSPSGLLEEVTPQNLLYQNGISLQANLPFVINNWWEMNVNITGGLLQFKEDYTIQPAEKTYLNYTLQNTQTFKLPGSFAIELSGYYNSSSYNGTRKEDGFGVVNAGIKKTLDNNRGSFQLSIADFLETGAISSYFGKLTTEAFDLKTHVIYSPEASRYPLIRISYSRSFGSGTKRQNKKNSAGEEEKERVRNN